MPAQVLVSFSNGGAMTLDCDDVETTVKDIIGRSGAYAEGWLTDPADRNLHWNLAHVGALEIISAKGAQPPTTV